MSWTQKTNIEGLPYFHNAATGKVTWDKPEELMSAEEKDEESGKWVWIPHPTKLWQPARVLEESDAEIKCQPRQGKPVSLPKNTMIKTDLTGGRELIVPFWDLKLAQLNRPAEDLVQMDLVNDASIINNTRIRYEKDDLYTWVGAAKSVLISVNPYKKLPLYGSDMVDLYRKKPPNTHLKPHVFDIANDSYDSMLFDNKDQSVLISGESGAGKTVCTKQVLDFIAQVAGSEESTIEEKILKANPLLEAFGNAQTIRNNNSSRFGKWIEVHFDPLQRKVESAKITNYLLEKSRLVRQAKGERNYHIFYQLATDSEAMKSYELQPPESYHYTSQSGVYKAHLIDDAKEFIEVKEAFNLLGFTKEEQDFVLRVTSGILTLGNCEHKEKAEKDGVSGSQLKDSAPAKLAAKLMGFDEKDLEKVLNYRSISVKGVTNVIPLTPEKARSATDSLAMGIYSRLFDFLVKKINASLDGKRGKFIGVLDIFGFEIFEQNSFEQLCINFANEKLQQQFNRTTFKEEEALYEAEGIQFEHIEFIDNQMVLDMIEKAPKGLLVILDDELKIPEGSDVKYMNRIEDVYNGTAKFQTDKKRRLDNSFNFEIIHYAGVVNYNGENFMAKNTDSLFQDMYDLCTTHKNPLFSVMFPQINFRQMKSISHQFRQQLDVLMKVLYETESRYIRCVKPNGKQAANAFDSFLVIDQLRYSGVFEAVAIRKQGYPFRFTYAKFACRYGCINRKHKYTSASTNAQGRVKEILRVSQEDFTKCVYGKTMLLFKTQEYSSLELLRSLALETIIPKMQAVMKGHLAREFKRRCKKIDLKLVKALNKGNDLPLVTTAIDEVKPTIGAHYMSLFSGYWPLHQDAAILLKKNLLRWVKVEKKLEDLLKQDPNVVYYDLAKAHKEGEGLRAENIKETTKQTELMKTVLKTRQECTMGKIDFESQECLKVLDLTRMATTKADAEKYKFDSPAIQDIIRILALPEMELVKLEIEKAKEMSDEKRRIHREIKLFHLELNRDEAKYSNLMGYSRLRTRQDYATGGFSLFGGRQRKEDQMLIFTAKPTLKSLCTLDAAGPEEKALLKQVKAMSTQLRQYMGDRPLKPPMDSANLAAATMINTAMTSRKGLVDEMYFQVVKQVHEHPTPENAEKGYQLFAAFLGTILPSDDLLKLLLVHLKKKKADSFQKYLAILHETQYGDKKTGTDATKVANLLEEVKNGTGRSRWSIADGDHTGPSK